MSGNEIVALSNAPAPPLPPALEVALQAYTPPAVSSLGGRSDAVPPRFNVDLLATACTNVNLLSNPGHSIGCSPVLRELLMQSGVEFSISREVFAGDLSTEHSGGNAIDLTGTPEVLSAVARFLRTIPSLFKDVGYRNATYSAETLFVVDGAIASAPSSSAYDSNVQMHVSSSLARMANGFATTAVRNALGDTSWTVPQFGSRNVYAAPTPNSYALRDAGGVNYW